MHELNFRSCAIPDAATGRRTHTDGLTRATKPSSMPAAIMRNFDLPVAQTYDMTTNDPISASLHAVLSYATSIGIIEMEAQNTNEATAPDLRATWQNMVNHAERQIAKKGSLQAHVDNPNNEHER